MTRIIVQVSNATGEFDACEFDDRRTVRIGQDQTDDLYLSGPNIAPSHLVLGVHQGTWRIAALTPLGNPTLNGLFLPPHVPQIIQEGAIVRVGNNELRFFHPPPSTLPETQTLQPAEISQAYLWQAEPRGLAPASAPYIAAQLEGVPETGLRLAPGESNTFFVRVTNKGPQQARFNLRVTGIPSEWCSFQPGQPNIYPGDQVQITVAMKLPKTPLPSEGSYKFQLRIESQDYAGHDVLRESYLTVLPYYDFAASKPFPWRQSIPWYKGQARFLCQLHNKGNAPLEVQILGQDDEEECHFSFQLNKGGALANGTDRLPLPAGQQTNVVVVIDTPRHYPIFFRSRTVPFSVTAIPQASGLEMARLNGRLVQRPLIGLLPFILLILLLLLVCAPFALWPHILSFRVDRSVAPLPKQEGQTVSVEWWTSPLVASLRLEPGGGVITNEPIGSRQIMVNEETTFELEAENLFSRLVNTYLWPGMTARETRFVPVTPIPPSIAQLAVSATQALPTEEVELTVDIRNAHEAALIINGTPQPLVTEAFQGKQSLTLEHDTSIVAVARKNNLIATQVLTVVVVTPTSTPTTVPELGEFRFSSTQVSAGEAIELTYAVSGGGTVILEPVGALPPSGSVSLTPQESTVYTLMTVDEAGNPTVLASQQVVVESPTSTPTATATPAPPTIVEFNTSKSQVAINDPDDDDGRIVTLFWTVEGAVTDIQLLNRQGVAVQTGLTPVGQMDVLVGEDNDQFILIAFNGQESSRKTVFIKTVEKPRILYFKATITGSDVNFDNSQKTCSTSPNNYDNRKPCLINSDSPVTVTVTLSWDVEGATQVKLEQQDDESTFAFNDNWTLEVANNKKKWFTLVAKSDTGQDQRKLIVCNNLISDNPCKR